MVVDTIAAVFQDAWIELVVVNAVSALPDDLLATPLTILAAPTYDHGVLHAPYAYLLHTADSLQMYTKLYAVVWLGDDTYDSEYNIEAVSLLEQFVQDHGGRVICQPLKINKSPVDQLDTVRDRARALITNIKPYG